MRVAPVEAGQAVELTADLLVAGGDALCRIEGFPVFVPGLFPGDVALVEIVEARKLTGFYLTYQLLLRNVLA